MEVVSFVSFLHLLIEKKQAKKALVITTLVFAFIYIGITLLVKDNIIDSIQIGIETIIILIFSFYYLYERMNDTSTLFIYNTYPFWVILGMVLYLSGSFFVYIFADSLSLADREKFWIIPNIFSIIKSILFVIAIIIHATPKKNTLITDLELSRLN